MINENELILFLLGLAVFVFVLRNISKLKDLDHSHLFFVGFYLFFVGWILTILEGFFWGDLLNIFEHISYAGSAVITAIWSWNVFSSEGSSQ